jgi:hypothetical protein
MHGLIQTQLKKGKDFSQLDSYLAMSDDQPNKSELAGIYTFALGLKPASPKHLATAKAVLTWTARLKINQKNSEKWSLVKPWAVTVFEEMWSFEAGDGKRMGVRDFLDMNRTIASLILPWDSVQVMLDSEDFNSCSLELISVVNSCAAGSLLFGKSAGDVAARRIDDKVRKEALKLYDAMVTEAVIRSAIQRVSLECEAMPGANLVPDKRSVSIIYRGKAYTRNVSNTLEFITKQMWATAIDLPCWMMQLLASQSKLCNA